jgi:hypothetical protein
LEDASLPLRRIRAADANDELESGSALVYRFQVQGTPAARLRYTFNETDFRRVKAMLTTKSGG